MGGTVGGQGGRPALRSGRAAPTPGTGAAGARRLSGLPRSLRLVVGAAPRHIVIMLPVYALFRLIEPATVWFSKFLVEALIDNRPLTALVIASVYILLRIVVEVATWIFELVVASQRERLRYSLQSQLMHKATTMPDLTLYESAGFYDKLQNARRSMGSAEELTVQVVNGFSVVLVLATLLGSLVLLHPVAALVVCIATVPMYLGQIRYAEGYSWVFREQAPQTRRLEYYFQLLTTDSAAKEIRLFGLGGLHHRAIPADLSPGARAGGCVPATASSGEDTVGSWLATGRRACAALCRLASGSGGNQSG